MKCGRLCAAGELQKTGPSRAAQPPDRGPNNAAVWGALRQRLSSPGPAIIVHSSPGGAAVLERKPGAPLLQGAACAGGARSYAATSSPARSS